MMQTTTQKSIRSKIRFILVTTDVCLSLIFLPGFTCQSLEDDLAWESFILSLMNESKTNFLTVLPDKVVIPQGQSATVTLDFSYKTNEIPEKFFYDFKPAFRIEVALVHHVFLENEKYNELNALSSHSS